MSQIAFEMGLHMQNVECLPLGRLRDALMDSRLLGDMGVHGLLGNAAVFGSMTKIYADAISHPGVPFHDRRAGTGLHFEDLLATLGEVDRAVAAAELNDSAWSAGCNDGHDLRIGSN